MNYYLTFVLLVLAASQVNAEGQPREDKKVNVTLYYESLCIDCVKFIKYQMWPSYPDLKDKMEIELVPFGKANWTENPWSITCQHGPKECYGNVIQACAMERSKTPEKKLEFVNCVMSSPQPDRAGARCAKQLGLDFTEIEKCAVGEEGRNLQRKYGNRTKNCCNGDIKKYDIDESRRASANFKKVVMEKYNEINEPTGVNINI